MIGPEIFGHFTPSMELFHKILHNRLPFDPQYELNFVHVKDVAMGMVLAEKKGRIGERYILGNKYSESTTTVIQIAKNLYPSVRVPQKAGRKFQLMLAAFFYLTSKLTGNPPLLLKGNINHYYKKKENLNIKKAKTELSFVPRKPEEAIRETLEYIAQLNLE